MSSDKPVQHIKNFQGKEIEQERIIFAEIQSSMQEKISRLEERNRELENKLSLNSNDSKEAEQTQVLLKGLAKHETIKAQIMSKKYYLTIAAMSVILAGILVPYSIYVTTLVGEQYRVIGLEPTRDGYVIQNIKGDTIDTWLSWRITDGQTLYVNIHGAEEFPRQTELIKDAIFSEEVYEIDDSLTGKGSAGETSLYYPGWAGAMKAASAEVTVFPIPTNFEVVESDVGAGDITIKLVDYASADGYGGFTKSIADENQNQILKSEITVYDVNNLTDEQFTTIIRHELGHAFGLAHATAPEDLMAPNMVDEFPYISECDVDAITSLYNHGRLSTVVCEK